MSKRIGLSTKEYLISAALPEATDTYTVIPHELVMAKTEEILKARGFIINKEMYKCNKGAKVAQGIYHLAYGDDPEMSMMVAWNNSYDKTRRFKFAVGGYSSESMNCYLSKNIGNWDRKHTGTADIETEETIIAQLDKANNYYAQLVSDKEKMKSISISMLKACEVVGTLFIDKGMLTTEQMSVIKAEYKTPSFNYNASEDSLWTFYNHISLSLQRSHPKSWMDQQRLIHWFLCNEFSIPTLTFDSEPVEEVETIVEFEKRSMEEKVEEEASVVEESQPVNEEPVLEIDSAAWNCLECNSEQKPDAIFYDGQLCQNCYSKALVHD